MSTSQFYLSQESSSFSSPPQLPHNLSDLAQTQPHICHICQKTFKKLGHFNRHITQRHTETRSYKCKQQNCDKTFKRGSHLKRHMISHTNVKNYKCQQCIMSFGYKHHLDRHVKLIHNRERMECGKCGMKFIKKKMFNKHVSKMHGQMSTQLEEGRQNCTISRFQKEQQLNSGDQLEHDAIFESNESEIKGEKEVEGEKELYRCQFQNCLSAFYRLYDFKRHLKNIHREK